MNQAIEIGTLIEISPALTPEAAFCILVEDEMLQAIELSAARLQKQPNKILWAIPRVLCGDSPTQYHPKFVMALLSSKVVRQHNSHEKDFLKWEVPFVAFETDDATRRSMTLNGMRMSTEYFATGSQRVLKLVEQRLQAGQLDVVHDLLIYLMQRVLQTRASAAGERALQAQSLAAYLGLNVERVSDLLIWPLQIEEIARQIKSGFAGTPRQNVDIESLVENQLARYAPAIERFNQQAEGVLQLMDQVILPFYKYGQTDC